MRISNGLQEFSKLPAWGFFAVGPAHVPLLPYLLARCRLSVFGVFDIAATVVN